MKHSVTLSFPPIPVAPFTWVTPLSYSQKAGTITGEYTEGDDATVKTWSWAYPASLSYEEALLTAIKFTS